MIRITNRSSVKHVAGVALIVAGCGLGVARPAAAQDDVDRRLVSAVAAGDGETARRLIDEGVDVDIPRADGVTPVLWAAHRDDLALVDVLVTAGADVNLAEDHGVTPLSLAAENASVTMVERLLEAGADANARQVNGVTPLMVASRGGGVDVIGALLQAGADVNAVTAGLEQTALMWAVAEGHQEAVRVLLEAGAAVDARSAMGFTPLFFAARNGDVDIARLLVRAGADVNQPGSDGSHALPLAIVSGQPELAQFLLEQGADPDGTVFGVGALHAAAGSVDIWLREWLRVRGVDGVFGSPTRGMPAGQREALVRALLDRGADPNARITTSAVVVGYLTPKRGAFEPYSIGTGDLRGATPLWVAAFRANRGGTSPEVVRVLLDAGADPHLTTDDGTTPLMAAAGLGHATFDPNLTRGRRSPSAEEAVRLLIEAGSDVNAVNEAGFTALHGAAYRGLNEVLAYLVAQGADIDATDFRGRTAYRLAEGAKQSFQFQAYPETAAFLAELGADTSLGIPGRELERQLERDVVEGQQGEDAAR